MKKTIKQIIGVIICFAFLAGNSSASDNDILFAVPDGQQHIADGYIEIFDILGLNSTVTEDLSLYENGLDTLGAVFLLQYELDTGRTLDILSEFLDNNGNLYFYPILFNWANFDSIEWFFNQYLPVGWLTQDSWPFTTFTGVPGTFMSGYSFEFPSQCWSSILTPMSDSVLVVLRDDSVVNGCVAAVTNNLSYNIIAAEFDLDNVLDGPYPNNRIEMFREFFEYFGIQTTDIEDGDNAVLPSENSLLTNYPNPFNSGTNIRLSNGKIDNNAVISIYNIVGTKVRELKVGEKGNAFWDCTNSHGGTVPSGIYFARYSDNGAGFSLKMTLLK